uniref:Uncharacterized protein n=1 Tax=Cannabis sativa TaxID=3483 RepID=A0A803NFD1_CANSA
MGLEEHKEPRGYNDAGEPLNEDGLPSYAETDHAEEELVALVPLPQRGEPEATWGQSRYFYFSQLGYIWFGGRNDPAMSKIGGYVRDYFMGYGAKRKSVGTRFQKEGSSSIQSGLSPPLHYAPSANQPMVDHLPPFFLMSGGRGRRIKLVYYIMGKVISRIYSVSTMWGTGPIQTVLARRLQKRDGLDSLGDAIGVKDILDLSGCNWGAALKRMLSSAKKKKMGDDRCFPRDLETEGMLPGDALVDMLGYEQRETLRA